MLKLIFIWALTIPVFSICSAQNASDLLETARIASEENKYAKALSFYQDYLDLTGNRSKVALPLAEAYFHQGFFSQAAEELYFLREQSPLVLPEIIWWEARVLHAQNRFSAAAKQYKDYWKQASSDKRRRAERALQDCESGELLQAKGKRAFVQNMGSRINTTGDELAPMYFSWNGEKGLLYSSNGQIKKRKELNGFSPYFVANLSEEPGFLSEKAPPIQGLLYGVDSIHGELFLYTGKRWPYGELQTCLMDVERKKESIFSAFEGAAEAKYGDTDLFYTDEECLLFAAQMEEGKGGYDVYKSCRTAEGWSVPQPLPGFINTSWHERSPSLHPNGEILFFASDRPGGLGGFDLYFSEWQGHIWGEPQSLGIGVNSLQDELFLRWGSDDFTAYFTSDRPGTVGGFDLFQAYFKEPFAVTVQENGLDETIAGSSVGKRKPSTELKKPLFFKQIEETISPVQQDYLIKVAEYLGKDPDIDVHLICRSRYEGPKKYDLFFSLKKAKEVAEELQAQGVSSQRIHLTGAGAGSSPILGRKENDFTYRVDILFSDMNVYAEKQTSLASSTFNKRLHQSDFFYLAPDSLFSGLTYSVQVAAFQRIFEGDVLEDFQWPMVKTRLDKEVNHYTIGVFTSYREAKNLRRRLLASGHKGAFIVAKIDGIRKTRGQLHPLKHKFRDLTSYIYVD